MRKQTKQKLQGELKNVPTDASQVCSSTTLPLNKDGNPSVVEKVLTCNNPEVNLPESNRVERKAQVFVLNVKGQPLMPTTPCKAKRLVKKGLAKVVKAYPFFVIQMLVQTRDCKQDVTLGIDSGYQYIGFSAVSSKKELISGTLILDGMTKQRLVDRGMFRKLKRQRNHWYRPRRHDNRAYPKGLLRPSIKRRYQTHLHLIDKFKTILPITQIIVETANFDIQKIQNPGIKGKQYCEGPQLGFENVKQYVLSRDERTCQHCGKQNVRLEVHHIKFRSQGGSDRPDNLITLCGKCHKDLHAGKFKLTNNIKAFRDTAFMITVRHRFIKDIPSMIETFGYITKARRLELGLEKTHYNDAFCIAGGDRQVRTIPIELKQKRRNNRVLQRQPKGQKPAIRRQRMRVQPNGFIWVDGKRFYAKCNRHKYIYTGEKYIRKEKITRFFNVGSIYKIM